MGRTLKDRVEEEEEKTETAMLHVFWAKSKARRWGNIFFGCLEQTHRSSSARTQCNKTLRR